MVMIFFHHSFIRYNSINFTSQGEILLINPLYNIWHWGFLATGVFFFLSGFGIYCSIQRNCPLTYSWFYKQMRKMILPFLFLWFIYLICFLIWKPNNINWSLLKDFFTLRSPGRETWFFQVIVGTYIVTFFIFKFIREQYRLSFIIGSTFIYVIIMAKYSTGPWWYNSIFNFPIGMLFAKYYIVVNKIPDYITIALSIITYFISFHFLRIDIIESLAFTFIIIWLCKYIDIRSQFLYFVGVQSLSFYFIEMPAKYFFCVSFIDNYWLFTISSIIVTSIIVKFFTYMQKMNYHLH